MVEFLLRHRKTVAVAAASAAFVIVDAARRPTVDSTASSRTWPSIEALAFYVGAVGVFFYLRSDRGRRSAGEASNSLLAAVEIGVAVSPVVVSAAVHFFGADAWVLWVALGISLVLLFVWSVFPGRRSHGDNPAQDQSGRPAHE
jgi:O-antigen/teichoic acid export membrane protein